jgi:hypothetical protein
VLGKVGIDPTANEVKLNGSLFEQTPGSVLPSKAVLMGLSDGANI